MRPLSKVVWHEGMHLAQHHFQAQGRYLEELTSFVVSSLFFAPYGLTDCELDREALRNDTVSLLRARGIMPDGLVFHFPPDPLPEPREVRTLFSPTQDSHLVLLGIPPFREGAANCAVDGADAGAARFLSSAEPLPDETTGQDVRPVALARKNFRLLLDVEDAGGLVTLPLARVRRDGAGHFVYDEEFVPPCVQIGASERLTSLLDRLVEVLGARADALSGAGGEGVGEVASYWLANALHASLGPLLHLARTRRAHPSELFVELSRLAGALCTFSMDASPRDLPLYEHDRLGECFGALDRRIREVLEAALPTRCVRVPVRASDESLYTGAVADARCFAASHWYLGVRSSLGPAEVAARVPRLVKVCSAKHVERLVREAYPGLPLEPVASPPPQISPRAGTVYFAIPRSGPCWSSIVETREVGIYAPAAIPDVELELVVALDG